MTKNLIKKGILLIAISAVSFFYSCSNNDNATTHYNTNTGTVTTNQSDMQSRNAFASVPKRSGLKGGCSYCEKGLHIVDLCTEYHYQYVSVIPRDKVPRKPGLYPHGVQTYCTCCLRRVEFSRIREGNSSNVSILAQKLSSAYNMGHNVHNGDWYTDDTEWFIPPSVTYGKGKSFAAFFDLKKPCSSAISIIDIGE